jgi:hypothetical protein
MAHSLGSKQRISAEDKRYQAWELRKRGHTYRQIAQALGCSEANAHKLVIGDLRRRIAKRVEMVEELVRL